MLASQAYLSRRKDKEPNSEPFPEIIHTTIPEEDEEPPEDVARELELEKMRLGTGNHPPLEKESSAKSVSRSSPGTATPFFLSGFLPLDGKKAIKNGHEPGCGRRVLREPFAFCQ